VKFEAFYFFESGFRDLPVFAGLLWKV